MNFGTNPCDVAFLALAPLAALISLRFKRRSYVVLALIVVALGGWGLDFASEAWLDAAWFSLMEGTPNPPLKLIEQFNTDAAGKAGVFLLGFPISLVYAAIWFMVVYGIRRVFKMKIHD